MVFRIEVHDGATFVAMTYAALATAVLAAVLPAHHAAAVEPIDVLRN